ncbi:MAG: hypothetical protein OEY89_09745, partial [Gammaproteobacteria bacterium]|nr:hypothetical protein [Gammaproteobacteria bacterium]
GFISNGKPLDYVEELLSPGRINDVGFFDHEQVSRLMEKARSYDLTRVGARDNMAFVLMLSTMLLDDMYIRNNDKSCSKSAINNDFKLL